MYYIESDENGKTIPRESAGLIATKEEK